MRSRKRRRRSAFEFVTPTVRTSAPEIATKSASELAPRPEGRVFYPSLNDPWLSRVLSKSVLRYLEFDALDREYRLRLRLNRSSPFSDLLGGAYRFRRLREWIRNDQVATHCCVVGEIGSGKTMAAKALMGMAGVPQTTVDLAALSDKRAVERVLGSASSRGGSLDPAQASSTAGRPYVIVKGLAYALELGILTQQFLASLLSTPSRYSSPRLVLICADASKIRQSTKKHLTMIYLPPVSAVDIRRWVELFFLPTLALWFPPALQKIERPDGRLVLTGFLTDRCVVRRGLKNRAVTVAAGNSDLRQLLHQLAWDLILVPGPERSTAGPRKGLRFMESCNQLLAQTAAKMDPVDIDRRVAKFPFLRAVSCRNLIQRSLWFERQAISGVRGIPDREGVHNMARSLCALTELDTGGFLPKATETYWFALTWKVRCAPWLGSSGKTKTEFSRDMGDGRKVWWRKTREENERLRHNPPTRTRTRTSPTPYGTLETFLLQTRDRSQ